MAGLAIPNDWVEVTHGFCNLTVQVPNSPMWRAAANGMLSNLIHERTWDIETSDSSLVQDTFDGQVSASEDDARESLSGGGFSYISDSVFHDSDPASGSRYIGGHRIENVIVPPGAIVTEAHVSARARNTSTDSPNLDIHAEDVDNAPSFLVVQDVLNRNRTTASVQWIATDVGVAYVDSPDIKSVIQEVINRPGWASGQSIVILMVGKDDIASDYRTRSYDLDPASSLKLHIEYQIGADTSPEAAALIGLDILNSINTDCP